MKFKDLIIYNEIKFLNPISVNLKYVQLLGKVSDFSFLWFITFEILDKIDISKVYGDKIKLSNLDDGHLKVQFT